MTVSVTTGTDAANDVSEHEMTNIDVTEAGNVREQSPCSSRRYA